VRAVSTLGALQTFEGMPGADRLLDEALMLAQGLGLGPEELCGVFMHRGIWFANADRNAEATMHHREAIRLAEIAGKSRVAGISWLNLGSVLCAYDPVASVEASRQSVTVLRRLGERYAIAISMGNLCTALLATDDWDEVARVLSEDAVADGTDQLDQTRLSVVMLAALRGDVETAQRVLDEMDQFAASEDLQERSSVAMCRTLAAAAAGQASEALRHGRDTLRYAETLGIGHDSMRWAWPCAARAAHELGDYDAERELVALLDSYLPGRVPPMLRAERELVRARLAAIGDQGEAEALFAAAIESLRAQSTPYHLAHGLLDHAEFLIGAGDEVAAEVAVAEATEVGERLGCPPLVERAEALAADRLPVRL
jgi:hypothetical protein